MIIISTTEDVNDYSFRIRSVQAASVYRCNNDYKFVIRYKDKNGNPRKKYRDSYLDYRNAVINNSLFAKYARKHGVTVDKFGQSLDFIMMKFDYGVEEDCSDKQARKPPINAKKLRDYFYKNDATIIWKTYDKNTGKEIEGKRKTITYRMLMRSPGKAKEGHCVFVRTELHRKMLNYITMGLWNKMPNTMGAKITEMSAYAPLITATALDFIHIPVGNVFVLKDAEVSFYKKAFVVNCKEKKHFSYKKDYPAFEEHINQYGLTFYKKKEKENPSLKWVERSVSVLKSYGINVDKCPLKAYPYYKKECYVDRESDQVEIKNTLWDGMGLVDESIFPKDKEGFVYCRSHFFKSCLFRGNIQDYFRDYYKDDYETAYETDMLGRRMKITDVKVIVTENSLKWMKLIDIMSKNGTKEAAFKYYERFMKKDGELFEIVKTAHSSKYGDLQRTSFQINNTLLTTDEEKLKKIASCSIEYCNKLKLDNQAFLDYLKATGTARYSINNVLFDLYNWNNKFRYTEYFKKQKDSKISELKNERLRLGKLFQHGDNLTICGNPIAMLMNVTNQDYLKEGCFKTIDNGIQCYTERFQEGEWIAGFRSPHNSPNNIVHLENVYPESIKKYFPRLGKNVIIINGINTDIQSRLNGQDLDSDFIFATNQKEIVQLAEQAYLKFLTIINDIPYGTNEYDKSMLSFSKMDSSISESQYAIGSASNIAQLALSYWFQGGCENRELEDIYIICSVLAQVAIDSVKRTFDVNVQSELNRVSSLPSMKLNPKYPRFYAESLKYKNRNKQKNKLEIEDDTGDFNCPMDILYRIINEGVLNLQENKELNTETIHSMKPVFEYQADHTKTNRKQNKTIIAAVKKYDESINKLNRSSETYHDDRYSEFQACMKELKNVKIKKGSMEYLINYAFKKENEKIRNNLLVALYDKDKDLFLKSFKKTEESSQKNAGSL